MAMAEINIQHVEAFWRWLGHTGYTELRALHKDFLPGKDNWEHNKAHNAYPKIAYTQTAEDVVRFAQQYSIDHMVCASLNDREQQFKNEHGYPRGAREGEVTLSRNLVLDIDCEGKQASDAQLQGIEHYLQSEGTDWFHDLGFVPPAIGFSGRGYHLFAGYGAIHTSETPDISRRVRAFSVEFQSDHGQALAKHEAHTDAKVFDLHRLIKLYGTAKTDVGIISVWHGTDRQEDDALRDYLLSMTMEEVSVPPRAAQCQYGPQLIGQSAQLPELFQSLLKRDPKLRALWSGQGKDAKSDNSRSGYDYSVVRHLLAVGYRNIDDLSSVLLTRPDGAVRMAGKDESYIRRTIANALMR